MQCPRCGWKINTLNKEKVKEISENYPKTFSPWGKEATEMLVAMVKDGKSVYEISEALQRAPTAIKRRIELLGVAPLSPVAEVVVPEKVKEVVLEKVYYDKA